MIAIRLRAINLRQFTSLSRLQVEQPLLTLFMPDREVPIVHQCKKHILPVIRRTRPRQTLTHRNSVEDGIYPLAVFTCLRVKGNLAEVVFLVLVIEWVLLLFAGHVIERLAIGREDGRVLTPVLGREQRVHQ